MATQKLQVYKCDVCGSIVQVLHEGEGEKYQMPGGKSTVPPPQDSPRRAFLDRVEESYGVAGEFGGVGFVGVEVHVQAVLGMHSDGDVAEDQRPLAGDADADDVAVTDGELHGVLG